MLFLSAVSGNAHASPPGRDSRNGMPEGHMDASSTRFLDEVSALKAVLASRGLSRRIVWVFREQVVILGSRVFVRDPVPLNAFHRTRALYDACRASQAPAVLSVLCTVRPKTRYTATACYLSRAVLDDERTRFRYPLRPPAGTTVRSPTAWRLLRGIAALAPSSALHDTVPRYTDHP